MNDGLGNHDLWITKLDEETWKQAVSRKRFYPDDMEMLTAWAIEEDSKCLLGGYLRLAMTFLTLLIYHGRVA